MADEFKTPNKQKKKKKKKQKAENVSEPAKGGTSIVQAYKDLEKKELKSEEKKAAKKDPKPQDK